MPQYHYTCKCGWTECMTFSMKNHPQTIPCEKCDAQAERDIGADCQHSTPAARWPAEGLQPEALGDAPHLADYHEREALKRGVPTEFNKVTGNPIFMSKSHVKKYCDAFGYRFGGRDPVKKKEVSTLEELRRKHAERDRKYGIKRGVKRS